MTDDPKPTITPEEMQRRRDHVRGAIADSRIEGMATGAVELEIFEAYIRGEIEAGDLVTASRIPAMIEAPADRLFSAIEHWLWQVAHPAQLANWRVIGLLIDGLSQRPDAATDAVQRAIAECRFYREQPWT